MPEPDGVVESANCRHCGEPMSRMRGTRTWRHSWTGEAACEGVDRVASLKVIPTRPTELRGLLGDPKSVAVVAVLGFLAWVVLFGG